MKKILHRIQSKIQILKQYDLRIVVFALLTICILFFSAMRSFVKYNSLADYNISKEVKAILDVEVDKYFHLCNDVRLTKQSKTSEGQHYLPDQNKTIKSSNYIKVKELKLHTQIKKATEADRANGIDAIAVAKYEAIGKQIFSKTLNLHGKSDLSIARDKSYNVWYSPNNRAFNPSTNYFYLTRTNGEWHIKEHQFQKHLFLTTQEFSCDEIDTN